MIKIIYKTMKIFFPMDSAWVMIMIKKFDALKAGTRPVKT